MQPLTGIRVLDFTTLLPGPLATLILAEAGADVVKIERPGKGDEMRSYRPFFGPDSVNFALLNRGKRSVTIDLKDPQQAQTLLPLLREADIIVEQFRPGVMERLRLGYEDIKAVNPRIIYCSITGYGREGPKAHEAGHDLNYIAETGVLALSGDDQGNPIVPPALVADIGAGTMPAVINVLLALRERDRTGQGCHLDIAMCDNLFTFQYWALGNGLLHGEWPIPGGERLTGGSPRYAIYRTQDGKHLAAAPLEETFWQTFCELIQLPAELRRDSENPARTRDAVRAIIGAQSAEHWERVFHGHDACCRIVVSLRDALDDPHFRARGLFDAKLTGANGQSISALPVPVAPQFRDPGRPSGYPTLGSANALLSSSVKAR